LGRRQSLESAQGLKNILTRNGISAESDCGGQFFAYLALLKKWNSIINLTGSNSWRVLGLLFEEGIWAGTIYPKRMMRHLDVGSGAGFPAVPIRILNPEMHLDLVEARAKRAAFLETVVYELGLNNVNVTNQRLDVYLQSRTDQEGWDCISWKGLRLGTRDVAFLAAGCKRNTEFWIFHGRRSPVEMADLRLQGIGLQRRERFPGGEGMYCSIYERLCFT
jgi:16S rRNA (guanine(527)-N(7))-methyltransferase RsmG